jgi:hypothetical protein
MLLPPPRVPPATIRSPRSHAQLCVQSVSRILSSGVQQCTEWVAVIVQKIVSSGAMLTLAHEGVKTTPLGCLRPSAAGTGCSVELVNGDIRAGWVAGPELPLATTVTND